MEFYFNHVNGVEIRNWLKDHLCLNSEDYYLIFQGKLVYNETTVNDGIVHIYPTVRGGKGGFGSMLRAIGAQIEKTTNREACRDLSGRRLRDINEEKRLKKWIDQQVDREKEAKERKQKKLERLCELPKHEFNDEEYNKERSVLPEIVEDAVLQGLQASTSSCSQKRKQSGKEVAVKKKKPKLWVDSDLEEDISDDNDDDSSDPDLPSTSKKTDNKLTSSSSEGEENSKDKSTEQNDQLQVESSQDNKQETN